MNALSWRFQKIAANVGYNLWLGHLINGFNAHTPSSVFIIFPLSASQSCAIPMPTALIVLGIGMAALDKISSNYTCTGATHWPKSEAIVVCSPGQCVAPVSLLS
jgi:hypothetical protein